MTIEVMINSRTFGMTEPQLEDLNRLLSQCAYKKAYSKEWTPARGQEIVCVQTTRWSDSND